MEYLADTVAIVRHLCEHPALGSLAAEILHDADVGISGASGRVLDSDVVGLSVPEFQRRILKSRITVDKVRRFDLGEIHRNLGLATESH